MKMEGIVMMQISSKVLLSIGVKILFVVLVAKVLAFSLNFFLPTEGVEMQSKKRYTPEYQRVDFRVMLESTKTKETKEQTQTTTSTSITNMILKGLYGTSQRGFAIVALKSSPKKTTIVSVGESFNGYELKAIYASKVLFERDAKEYVLELHIELDGLLEDIWNSKPLDFTQVLEDSKKRV